MKKLLDGMYLNFSLDAAPITDRESALTNKVKSICQNEYVELENIKYEKHCTDIEEAYKKGATDAILLLREIFIN